MGHKQNSAKTFDSYLYDMKMYKSIKRLRNPKGQIKNIVIHDNEGKITSHTFKNSYMMNQSRKWSNL